MVLDLFGHLTFISIEYSLNLSPESSFKLRTFCIYGVLYGVLWAFGVIWLLVSFCGLVDDGVGFPSEVLFYLCRLFRLLVAVQFL